MTRLTRLFTTLLTATILISSALAQSSKERVSQYINEYKELAISEMLRTGVPASVTLAQGILETAGGQSDLATLANNHFGIKCKSTWNGDYMLHDDETRNECFRKYSNAEELYRDHSEFLKSRPAYAFLFKLDPTDYEGWAKGLRKAGYATSNSYSQALIKLIVENNLQDFTLLALQRTESGDDLFVTTQNAEVKTNQFLEAVAPLKENLLQEKLNVKREQSAQISKTNQYPVNAIFAINEAKVIYAQAGTSLFALANNYNVSYRKLIEFNELDDTDILPSGQLIFLQKKSKKGSKDVHIVEPNENLQQISQAEGIQLASMLEYNGLRKGMQPIEGEKIYLKYPAPASPKVASAISFKPSASM